MVTVLLAAPAPAPATGEAVLGAEVVAEAASAFRSSTLLAGLGLGGTAGGWRGVRLRKVTDSEALGELGTGVLSLPALAAEVLALLALAAEVLSLVLLAPEVLASGVLSLFMAAVEAFSLALASVGALPAAVADCCRLSEAVLLTSPLAAARLLPDSEAVLSSPGRGLALAPAASSALLTWSSSVSLACILDRRYLQFSTN